jgi:endonuclease YncB( thermonuclease family)
MVVITLLALTFLAPPAHAEIITGKARIVDGDTIEVAGTRIRLEGIDAPERGQDCKDRLGQPYDCGATAVRTLVDLTKGQEVTCEPVGQDRYRRTLAICRLPSGLDLNAEMVRQGRSVAFRRYSERYVAEEDEAQRAGAGLWAGTFEHPGCWRAQLRGNKCQDALPSAKSTPHESSP